MFRQEEVFPGGWPDKTVEAMRKRRFEQSIHQMEPLGANRLETLPPGALARRLEQSWQEVKRRPMYHQQLTQVWKQVLETIDAQADCLSNEEHELVERAIILGGTAQIEDAAELEAAAQLVVRVEKTEREENVAEPLNAQGAYHGYTLSEVSVKEVLTDSAGRNVQPGDRLQILENQFTYAEQDGTQATCHINRYVKMQPGKEYYLFLRYSEENGYYVILSGLLGKVPVDESEAVLFPAAELTQLSPDAGAVEENSETKQLLERIREESIARYGAQ